MNTLQMPQYVALDRDGTVLRYVPYLKNLKDVHLIPSAGSAIARLNQASVPVVLVTNQSVVSSGCLSMKALDQIHAKVVDFLAQHDAHLDAILVCPHAPADRCLCRKPLPGLLAPFLEQEHLEPSNGFVVGDNLTDIEFAINIGAKPVHVQGGVHSQFEVATRYAETPSFADLGQFVDFILGELK